MVTKSPVLPLKFSCKLCDYNTCNKKDFNRHTSTVKHQKRTNDNKMVTNDNKMITKSSEKPHTMLACDCGKQFVYASGLSRHKKTCDQKEKEKEKAPIDKELIIELLKQNNQFGSMLAEQNKQMVALMKKGLGNTTNTNSFNTTNKNKFNLNIFLNEQCKDAMNIMDFVDSLKLQITDLERVGELGYAKGISNIIVNALHNLDKFKRPIHCSDMKREIIYVKDKDAWEKENNKEKMTTMIKHVAHKNIKQLSEWKEEHPEYKDGESVVHEQFLKIVNESMGGHDDEEDSKNYNKIIQAVAKEVVICKEEEVRVE